MKQFAFFLLLFYSLSSIAQQINTLSGYELSKRMFDKANEVSTLTYIMTKEERIDGKMTKQASFTKMQKEPFKVYVKQLYPKKGIEILYVEGENSKALVNPNGFPWVNLRLNPNEGIMTSDQHHTIFDSGFDLVVSILEHLCHKYHSEINDIVTYEGDVEQSGRLCHEISMINPYYKYMDYEVKEGETVETIAKKHMLTAYMILELNPSVKHYSDIKAGQIITIPNDYSPKMSLFIDAETYTPVLMEVYDDKGLYEQYEYSEVVIDPIIKNEEFTAGYGEYGF